MLYSFLQAIDFSTVTMALIGRLKSRVPRRNVCHMVPISCDIFMTIVQNMLGVNRVVYGVNIYRVFVSSCDFSICILMPIINLFTIYLYIPCILSARTV